MVKPGIKLGVLVILLAGIGYLAFWFATHGFSAREEPSWLEKILARHARRIATPAGSRDLKNPFPLTPESMKAAREHWVGHCSTCHALDGSGNTTLGRNLYPKAPDLRDGTTQNLSDGELYYIITNGVRFTGMPAWGGEHSPEETWQLVSLIRRLPHLSPEELREMERPAAREPETSAKPADTHARDEGSRPHKH